MAALNFNLPKTPGIGKQLLIREMIASDILEGLLQPGQLLPSSRNMARQLEVSRTTVNLAYQRLIDDGFLSSKPRSGIRVSYDPPTQDATLQHKKTSKPLDDKSCILEWEQHLVCQPTDEIKDRVIRTNDWRNFPYPFVFGHADPELFPFNNWRQCAIQAGSRRNLDTTLADYNEGDDSMLHEYVRARVLPRRGIRAKPEELLITLGSQNALFLIAELLIDPHTNVMIEEPGYPGLQSLLLLKTKKLTLAPVDHEGLNLSMVKNASASRIIFVTPNSQCPTMVTMPESRRVALLAHAAEHNQIIVEDDYDFELWPSHTQASQEPSKLKSLKSIDEAGRVIYVGSFSKSLFPGLRIGFLVGSPEFIRQARTLRYLMLRHAPSGLQRTLALFLALGHHDAHLRKLAHSLLDRLELMRREVEHHLPGWTPPGQGGGACLWLRGPDGFNARLLSETARTQGILINPGDVFYVADPAPMNHFRLACSVISKDNIPSGIAQLAALVNTQMASKHAITHK